MPSRECELKRRTWINFLMGDRGGGQGKGPGWGRSRALNWKRSRRGHSGDEVGGTGIESKPMHSRATPHTRPTLHTPHPTHTPHLTQHIHHTPYVHTHTVPTLTCTHSRTNPSHLSTRPTHSQSPLSPHIPILAHPSCTRPPPSCSPALTHTPSRSRLSLVGSACDPETLACSGRRAMIDAY